MITKRVGFEWFKPVVMVKIKNGTKKAQQKSMMALQ
jgi:hypothetical protein